ncbi:MFS transporter [Intrasporangium chromatireducens Q5-1]|uniref:MFS transporter n=1 Tax=Intrasporangium chromatireducens Q5-1 TaxID=584657 RepID=W9GLG9_9MICO|nr:MFS transporter [Intrasporangium chromatireducens]EWT06945.1 MFS transporter [Intrasporangium chromatireducens Q5-1]
MTKDQGSAAPSLLAVLRVPKYLPVFLVSALSLWGDNIARITIAAIVFQRTESPLATATTLAVSLLPTVFGRSLLGPIVDRFPYKWVLVGAHLLRALCVAALMVLVAAQAELIVIFAVLFLLETIGGAAAASNMVLMTDLFADRRYYARAIGLNALSEQTNQAVGLAVGGALVTWLGAEVGLLADLGSFLVAALTILVVVEAKPVSGQRGRGVGGFVKDLRIAVGDMTHHPVLARFVLLSVIACVGIAAPEALAIPIAGDRWWSGLLMAAPVAGAVLGILLITRRDVHWQNNSLIPLAMLMPLPLIATILQPPFVVLAGLWFLSGMLQAFMVPLQATFTLVTPEALRGRIFSLAGAASVGAAGLSYLGAGWLAQHTGPAAAVTICAGLCLVLVALLGLRWPDVMVRQAVDAAYTSSTARAA